MITESIANDLNGPTSIYLSLVDAFSLAILLIVVVPYYHRN